MANRNQRSKLMMALRKALVDAKSEAAELGYSEIVAYIDAATQSLDDQERRFEPVQ
jgi:hypothetical protein